jgi:hypothetical protein
MTEDNIKMLDGLLFSRNHYSTQLDVNPCISVYPVSPVAFGRFISPSITYYCLVNTGLLNEPEAQTTSFSVVSGNADILRHNYAKGSRNCFANKLQKGEISLAPSPAAGIRNLTLPY